MAKRKLKKEDFISLGKKLMLTSKQVEGVFKRFLTKREHAAALIDQSFLSVQFKKKYQTVLDERFLRFSD